MFNAIIDDVYILGFRIMNGFILPPSTQNKVSGKYYPVIYMTRDKAEKFYDEVALKCQNWNVELRGKKEAINDLLCSAGVFGIYYG